MNPDFSYKNRCAKYFEELEQKKAAGLATEPDSDTLEPTLSDDVPLMDMADFDLTEGADSKAAQIPPPEVCCSTKGCENMIPPNGFVFPGFYLFHKADEHHYGLWSRYMPSNPTCEECSKDKVVNKQLTDILLQMFKAEMPNCKKIIKKKLFYTSTIEEFYAIANAEVHKSIEQINKETKKDGKDGEVTE